MSTEGAASGRYPDGRRAALEEDRLATYSVCDNQDTLERIKQLGRTAPAVRSAARTDSA